MNGRYDMLRIDLSHCPLASCLPFLLWSLPFSLRSHFSFILPTSLHCRPCCWSPKAELVRLFMTFHAWTLEQLRFGTLLAGSNTRAREPLFPLVTEFSVALFPGKPQKNLLWLGDHLHLADQSRHHSQGLLPEYLSTDPRNTSNRREDGLWINLQGQWRQETD